MNPFDIKRFKESHGANLFIGGLTTWIGNDITVEDNGDVLLNKKIIPAELLWKCSLKHVNSPDPQLEKELSEIKHPIVQGFKSISLLYIIIGIIAVLSIILLLLSLVK